MKKTVLITGASGDIGQEIAKIFAHNGYTVVGIYYKNEVSIQKLSLELGESFHSFSCDLSDFQQCELLFENLEHSGLLPDILVNNAGISVIGLLQDMDSEIWNNLWNTNVTSALALSKQAIPVFLKKGCGKIINISSVWGNCGAACEVGYSATKGALNTFTKALAKELAPSNIQVNAISCGIIDTKMNRHLSSEDIDEIIKEIPASRLGTPKDIADAVYALSNAGSYMTGQIITVDGGWQI
jgi:3-oxoacyl-[acyl-carrier protein] reductase